MALKVGGGSVGSVKGLKCIFMETVDKQGRTIVTGWATVPFDFFLEKVIKPFKEIRVGVQGNKPPFAHTYFRVQKKEVVDIVRMNQCKVRFSIMFNSKMDKELNDVLYINRLTTPV